jgi:hypothetical protein
MKKAQEIRHRLDGLQRISDEKTSVFNHNYLALSEHNSWV